MHSIFSYICHLSLHHQLPSFLQGAGETLSGLVLPEPWLNLGRAETTERGESRGFCGSPFQRTWPW